MINRVPNCPKMTSFKELMNEIAYDWEYQYGLCKDERGNFHINKLYIEPHRASYKTQCWELDEGIFEKVQILYTLLKEDNES